MVLSPVLECSCYHHVLTNQDSGRMMEAHLREQPALGAAPGLLNRGRGLPGRDFVRISITFPATPGAGALMRRPFRGGVVDARLVRPAEA